jgi:hypothetical protein
MGGCSFDGSIGTSRSRLSAYAEWRSAKLTKLGVKVSLVFLFPLLGEKY